MSLGQDKGHDRKRIFRPRSWGASGRRLASRLEIRVESCFTIASASGSRILVSGGCRVDDETAHAKTWPGNGCRMLVLSSQRNEMLG